MPFIKGQKSWNTGHKLSKKHLENVTVANKINGIKKRGIIPKNIFSLNGQNHWNWKGGISKIEKLIRGMPEYKIWRENVFKRDNYTCRGCSRNKIYVTAHHHIPFIFIVRKYNLHTTEEARGCGELWDVQNGLTLCEVCHSLTDNYKGRARGKITKQ